MRQLIYLVISSVLIAALFTSFGTSPRYGNLLLYPFSPLAIDSESGVHKTIDLPFEGELWIGYDSLGIPHIKSDNERSASFGIGYVHARDRLFQMEMLRRQVLGRLSEVAGEKAMVLDRFWRKFRFEEQCKNSMAEQERNNPEAYAIYEAYAQGVNTYVRQMNGRELPLEFRLIDFKPMEFEPWHVLLLSKAMAYDLSYDEDDLEFSHIAEVLSQDLIDLYYPWVSSRSFPIYPDIQLTDSLIQAMPKEPLEIFKTNTAFKGAKFFTGDNYSIGSNNWAIAPKKSATGNPMLCNDTHLKLRLPGIWYEIVVTTDERKRRGLTVASSPMMLIGFNEYIAWGETNATWDLVDFYHLDINEKGDAYLLDGKEVPLVPFTETFKVKGGEDIQITYRQSFFGPVDTLYGEVLATAWVGSLSGDEGATFLGFQNARSVAEAALATNHFKVPPQNFVLIDREGHIGMVTGGVAERHKTRSRGIIHAKRSSDKADYFATNNILNEFDPERGWVASANQSHVYGEAAGWLSYRFTPVSRARRIAEFLNDSVKIDKEYMRKMHMDAFDEEWTFMRERMIANCPEEWKEHLRNWDGVCRVEEIAPALFVAYKRILCDLFNARLGPDITLPPQEELVVWLMSTRDTLPITGGSLSVDAFSREAFDSTVKHLSAILGNEMDFWQYGAYHKLHIRHIAGIEPLGLPPVAAMGSNRTINVASGFPTTFGPSMRLNVEMTPEGPNGSLLIHGGQNGRINSPNYADQVDDFREGRYHDAPLLEKFDPEQYITTIHFKK